MAGHEVVGAARVADCNINLCNAWARGKRAQIGTKRSRVDGREQRRIEGNSQVLCTVARIKRFDVPFGIVFDKGRPSRLSVDRSKYESFRVLEACDKRSSADARRKSDGA